MSNDPEKISHEDLELFLAQSTPRTIPKLVHKQALSKFTPISNLIVLFIFGSVVLVIILASILDINTVVADLRLDFQPSKQAIGNIQTKLIDKEESVTYDGAASYHHYAQYNYSFSFHARGVEYNGSCFGTGRFSEKQEVKVVYLERHPEINRIAGTTVNRNGRSTYLGILLALLFLCSPFLLLRRRHHRLKVLQRGEFAKGTISAVEPTGTTIGSDKVYKVTLSFMTTSGEHTTVYKALGENGELAQWKQEQGETVGVLYNPKKPNRLIVLDTLAT